MKAVLKSPTILFFFILGCLFLISCSNSYIEDVKRGGGYAYQPGYPELQLEVTGYLTPQGSPKLKITGFIPQNSLVFKIKQDSLIAIVHISVEVLNTTINETESFNYTAKVTKKASSSFFNEEGFYFNRELDALPGDYNVTVSATDQASNKTIVRKVEAYLPDTENDINNITNIQLLAKHEEYGNKFFPVTTYDINLTADSLKFQFQVLNTKDEPITIQARLIKFRADTNYADPMNYTNLSASSIQFKGIDYRNYEIIQSTQRQLNQPGNVTIEFAFKNLTRGNYRFEVGQNLEERDLLYKARDFSIKSDNYPSIKTAKEMAAPLIYLMSENEYEELMSLKSDEDSLKAAIDRFWLENIQNSSLAKNIISLFYQRVEEANKLFSNFKEGWKTDMGMVYILFGPPLYQDKRLGEIRWSYYYDTSVPEYTYFFKKSKTKSAHYPFDHYVLQRGNQYFQIQYKVKELWLTGSILHWTL